jgi:hypothetical protein
MKKLKNEQTVETPVAQIQKKTYTFHIDSLKIVIEATSEEEAKKLLEKQISVKTNIKK